ncbi:RIP metalloprotease RseP [Bacteroidota bacterium]|nr:RIP metalloprotease RseP [Bacteroidota bacterium]
MEILIKISQFILSLSLIIVLHEFGHYWPARYFKIKVEKFYLFFDVNFSLFKKKIGETEWGIGWLPLGGYVKIAGMIDESMDKEQMAKPPQPWEFRSKPSWQRLIVMLGGVTVNFIMAIIIYIGLAYSYGSSSISLDSIKDGYLISNPVFLDSGFKTGDKILTVDGEKLSTYSELRKSIIGSTTYQVDRNGDIIEINLPVDFLGKLSSSDDVSSFELRMPFIIQSVSEESLNKDYDLRQGDIVVSINGQEIKYADQTTTLLKENSNRTIEVELLRDSFRLKKTLNVDENGNLGIFFGATVKNMVDLGYIEVVQNSYSLLQSVSVGINKFVSFTGFYLEQFVAIFNPSTGAYKGLGGFIAIGNIFPSSWDWQSFWSTTAFLSIMLGVLNLLPIPALDGGHAMFLMYEMISGRKPSDKFMQTVQVIGFIILLSLVIFANGNDIYKLFNFIV